MLRREMLYFSVYKNDIDFVNILKDTKKQKERRKLPETASVLTFWSFSLQSSF
jgi:hypothetical protein